MKTIHALMRELSSLEERAHLSTLVSAFEAARATFGRRGGAAIVVWLEDGDPLVLTTSFAKLAIVMGRWLTTTQVMPIEAPPATPRNDGGDS